MTGLLDGRGGCGTTPPEGVGLSPAPSIERPSVEHTAGRGHAGTGGSPSLAAPPPADGRSVMLRAFLAWQRTQPQYALDLEV